MYRNTGVHILLIHLIFRAVWIEFSTTNALSSPGHIDFHQGRYPKQWKVSEISPNWKSVKWCGYEIDDAPLVIGISYPVLLSADKTIQEERTARGVTQYGRTECFGEN